MEVEKIPAAERFKNRYSYAYKVAVVEAVENGKFSQNQASRKYGVHRKTISKWIKKYSIFIDHWSRIGCVFRCDYRMLGFCTKRKKCTENYQRNNLSIHV